MGSRSGLNCPPDAGSGQAGCNNPGRDCRNGSDMLNHFREHQRAHLALPGVPIFGAVVEGTVALTLPASLAVHLIQWAIVSLFVVIAILMRELSIRVDTENLVFGFGPLRRKLRLSDINGVKVLDTETIKTGPGIRALSEGRMAWIAATGTAVEVKTVNTNGHPAAYVISTNRPHDLASALQSGQTSRTLE